MISGVLLIDKPGSRKSISAPRARNASQSDAIDFSLPGKPAGMTSHDVVAQIRRLLSTHYQLQTRPRVGHTGTLDPFATGLLIVAIGKATKLIKHTHDWPKEYEAILTLGATSTTDDLTGEITEQKPDVKPTNDTVTKVLSSFLGEQRQLPPKFSAKKVGGERAYKKMRRGDTVKLYPHIINIHSLKLISYKYPEIKIKVSCSTGTYIRALARDIGQMLTTSAYCSSLRRTSIGPHLVNNATSLSDINTNTLHKYLLPPESLSP